ncbi:glycosyltransferase [Vibrio alfacsensis]|uniref:glycosyltransferase n=1 Tax=Vibrio alfacsensis TaxID=1074311 RepID=UPI00406905F4
MKAIFAHDHNFLLDADGNFYSRGKVNSEMFDIYLEYFNEIKVVGRCQFVSNKMDNVKPLNSSKISYSGFKNLSSIKELFNKDNIHEMCSAIKGYDFVIARLPSEIGLLAIEAAKKSNINYAIEFVACPWDGLWNYGKLSAKLYAPYYFYRNRKATLNSPSVIYVTNNFLQNRYPTKGFSTGVSDVEITKVSDYKRTLKKGKKIKLGLIGSLESPHKGIDTAIKAVRLLKEQGYEFELNILGPGSTVKWDSEIIGIEDRVNFVGILPPGDKVRKWLNSIDIYIQPSLQEGLPRAIIEAMSTGLPVVASCAGGIPELVSPNYIHNKKDYQKLTELLIKVSSENEYIKQSEFSLKRASEYLVDKLLIRRKDFWGEAIRSQVEISNG